MTIWGTNLGGAQAVRLDGAKTVYKIPAQNRIVLTIPSAGHSGRISIKTAGGMTLSPRFTVTG